MNNRIGRIFAYSIGLLIGVVLCIAIWIIATIMWPIFFIALLVNYCIRLKYKIEKRSNFVNTIEEFIFACYGFGIMFILLPFEMFNDEK